MKSHKLYGVIRIFLLVSILLLLISCISKPMKDAAVTEWLGREIKFSNDIQCRIFDKDTLSSELFNKPYKILIYIDPEGCTECKLKLWEWNNYMLEMDTIAPKRVSFLFYIYPVDKEDITLILRRDRFKHPVFIDTADIMNKLNHFPKDVYHQCFLLGRDNKVIQIGNPTMNSKLWDDYKNYIISSQ